MPGGVDPMVSWSKTLEIEARAWPGVLLERYHYGPGPPSDYPPHVHDTYQVGIALDRGGEYRYRGSMRPVPTRALVIVHPGERHSVRDTDVRRAPARYLMLYVDVEQLQAGAAEMLGRGIAPPFFDAPVFDADLVRTFLALFDRPGDSDLARDSRLLALFAMLTARHADEMRRPRAFRSAGQAVSRAGEYLQANLFSTVGLDELAAVAGLSRYHLVRQFSRTFGAPPHAYQISLRIDAARRLLASGTPVDRVARRTGFYDQSHFGRHFKRIAGVTPGSYARRILD